VGFPIGLNQKIHLDHRDGGSQRDEKRGPQSSGMSALTAFRSQYRSGDDRQEESESYGRPMDLCRHDTKLYDKVARAGSNVRQATLRTALPPPFGIQVKLKV
jgi:hypothetical protein